MAPSKGGGNIKLRVRQCCIKGYLPVEYTDRLNSGDIAEIDEPCTHSVQFGGMCVNCGRDMTE